MPTLHYLERCSLVSHHADCLGTRCWSSPIIYQSLSHRIVLFAPQKRVIPGYSQASQTFLYQLDSLHILKTFLHAAWGAAFCKMRSVKAPQQLSGTCDERRHVFNHICLFPHRTWLQLRVLEELIQLPLTWLRAEANSKPHPQSATAVKHKKSNEKTPNFHNFIGKHHTLLSVQL